ncbi:hypothetical protein CBS101457_001680 [Exobasidium rhododendri]|nr:hypothetical protein CBS101457_001680 [Exobasidium rhododendri]
MPLRLISTSLEAFAGSRQSNSAISHNIPTDYPNVPSSSQPAISAGCFTDEAFAIVSTPFADQYVLELQILPLTSSQSTLKAHQLLFSSPLLETAFLSSNGDNSLTLQVCTATGIIYRILLPLDLLESIDEVPARWISEYRLSSLGYDPQDIFEQGLLTRFHASDDGLVALIACKDGRTVKAVWEADARSVETLRGCWYESILRPDTFFSRLFSRSASTFSPNQVLAMSTYERSSQWRHTLGFTASRDRKLRIWDLGSDACIRVIGLPVTLDAIEGVEQRSVATVNTTNNDEGTNGNIAPFSTPPMIRIHADSHALYVVVYIPAPLPSGNFIVCYQVHFEGPSFHSDRAGAANLGQIDFLWEKRCDKETMNWNAELRDLSVISSANQGWKIRGVWDAAGKVLVKQMDATESEQSWMSISGPQSYSALHSLSLDEDLKAVSKVEDMAEFFMRRIVEPNRFSRYSMEQALQAYEDMLLDRDGMLPETITRSVSHSIREQIRAVVGCTIELEEDRKTGELLHDAHWTAFRKEWATFTTLLEEQEARESWPIGFVPGKNPSDEPFIVARGRLSTSIVEDPSSTLLRDACDRTYHGEGDEYGQVTEALAFAHQLLQSIHPAALDHFEKELLAMLETQSSTPPESMVETLWTSCLQGSIANDEETIAEDFALLGSDAKEAIVQTLSYIQRSEFGADLSAGGFSATPQMTELDAALCSDAMTQLSSDRLALARILNIFVFALSVGYLPYEDKVDGSVSLDELVGEVTATYHRLYAFDLLARRDGTVESITTEPSYDDGEVVDASAVAHEMEHLQFNTEAKKDSEENTTSAAINLIHACILRRRLVASTPLTASTSSSMSNRVYHYSSTALQKLLFSDEQALQPIDLTLPLALFANELIELGQPSACSAFVKLFPRTPASHYILARNHISCNEVELAASAFDQVIPAFFRLKEEHSSHRSGLMDMASLPIKRAQTTSDALFCYYRRTALYFQQKNVQSPFFVAHYAKRAIDAAATLSEHDTRNLQELRFNSLLALEWYKDAYAHLLAIPYVEEQRRWLPDLISRMCEQGQVELLLSLNFASLQSEVVSTLGFKARNSNSIEEIEFYFDLLYAFYVNRSDFKNAGATMWQMGIRLRQIAQGARRIFADGESQLEATVEEEVRSLSIMEARSYLASINVLSQLDQREAWFAHDAGGAAAAAAAAAAAGGAGEEEKEEEMNSRFTNYVPSSAFYGKSKGDNLRIVHLKDIRRRYQVRLAQLELFSARPQYSTSILTTDRNDAKNVISLLTSNDDFEKAFTLAKLLNVERTQIYTALTDRCVEMATWSEAQKGSSSSSSGSSNSRRRNGTSDLKQEKREEEEHPLIQALMDDQEIPGRTTMNDQGGFLAKVDRCTTWNGSTTQRAWRYLRLMLRMEKDASKSSSGEVGIVAKYHLIVLNRILHWHQYVSAPLWLVEWLRSNAVELFIKSLLAHDLFDASLEESLTMVKATTSSINFPRKRKRAGLSCEVYLPYLLLDELIERSEDALSATEQAQGASLIERRELVKELRDAIRAHQEHLKKVESQLRREQDENERRQRRYQERQEQEKQEQQRDVTMA